MNRLPFNDNWTAQRAVDGNSNQFYFNNSCAITQVQSGPLWWKVWLQSKFNIAYLEIYLRSDSKYLYLQYICLFVTHPATTLTPLPPDIHELPQLLTSLTLRIIAVW